MPLGRMGEANLSHRNLVLGVSIVLALGSAGCGALPPFNAKVTDCDTHPSGWCRHAEQSWDQERLKRNDIGCPTAVYIAPNGNLELCHP